MKITWILGLVLVPITAAAQIQIVSATYGLNCGATRDNAKAAVAGACDGRRRCEYIVDSHMLGDPAPGCAKTFDAEWACAAGGAHQQKDLPAEAGQGSRLVLSCGVPALAGTVDEAAKAAAAARAAAAAQIESAAHNSAPGGNKANELVVGTMELLKLDPNPVATNQRFAIVYRITNLRNTELVVSVDAKTDDPAESKTLTLAPGETKVSELSGFFKVTGTQDVNAIATWQTDQTIIVPKGPSDFEKKFVFKKLGEDTKSIVVYAMDAPPTRPQFVDLGPNQPNEENGGVTRSGVVGAMAGSQDGLFAIPKTAGVWRSVNGGAWSHLRSSPPRALSIAIEPDNTNHIAVGEREDDNPDPRLGRSGLWESTDFGNSWTYTYDPSPLATNQRIPAVAFSNTTSTLFIATSVGVARRPRSQTANPFSEPFTYGYRKASDPDCGATNSTTPLGAITAMVVSETRVWARTALELFYSDDDGKTWDCWSFPAFPTKLVDLPGDSNMQADFQKDNQSLGAFDDQAYVIFNATVPQSDSRSTADPKCNKDPLNKRYDPNFNQCQAKAVTPLLIFRPATKDYVTQYTLDNDGSGLGGRRFVKTYLISPSKCGTLAGREIGQGRQVFIGHGQSVEQALSADSAGRLVLDDFVGTSWAGPSTFFLDAAGKIVQRDAGKELNWNQHIHADLWDFLLPSDYCPLTKPLAFIASDGGVYQGTAEAASSRIAAMKWETRSEGLHVQTAQMLAIAEMVFPHDRDSVESLIFLGYPTQDNDSWWRTITGTWMTLANQGDSNFIAGDQAIPQAITWRVLTDGNAAFYSGSGSPIGFTLNRSTLANGQPFDGSATIQAVQTLASEPIPNSLDMVMLVQLPLPDSTGDKSSGNPVPDPPGGSGTGQRMALIRNPNFSKAPNGPATSFSGWSIVNDNIPPGAARLWLSGGHADTQYFLYTDDTNSACPRGLQRLTSGRGKAGRTSWQCLVQNLLDDGGVGVGVVRQQGPAFVDPFDPNIIVVVIRGAAGSPNRLEISLNAGSNFCQMPRLTALVTESGRYSLVGSYDPDGPDGPFRAVSSRFHGYPLSVPSHVAFDRHNPSKMLVASPYTGLYLGSVSRLPQNPGVCFERWNDLTPYLPSSRSYISQSAIFDNAAIVSTEGRGAYEVSKLNAALPASYFEPVSSASVAGQFAILHQTNGPVMPWGAVLVIGRNLASSDRLLVERIRSDENGRLFLPAGFEPGRYIMDLKFLGDGAITPSTVKFELTVQ